MFTKGTFINKIRVSRGMTQQMVADAMRNLGKKQGFSITTTTISSYELDKSNPSGLNEDLLCKALGIRKTTLAKYSSPVKVKRATTVSSPKGDINITINR